MMKLFTMSGDWMLFKLRTVVDAYLYAMCSWKDDTPTPLASFPALSAFKRKLDSDAGIQRALREQAASEGRWMMAYRGGSHRG